MSRVVVTYDAGAFDADGVPLSIGSADIAADTHAASSKTTPVDADELPLADSAGSFGLKKLTWLNLKATLKTYFDTLYATVGSGVASIAKSGSTALTGAVTLSEGANVTLTQAGNDISIAASGGGGSALIGTPELIYRYTVTGSDKASIDTGVDTPDAGSNDWTNGDLLEVIILARTDSAAAQGVVNMTLNNDGGANYDIIRMTGNPAATPTAQGAAAVAGSVMAFVAHGSGGGGSYASAVTFWIPNYAGTSFFKTLLSFQGTPDSTTTNMLAEERDYAWRNTAAVTRLKIAAAATDKLKVGTQLLIYKRRAT